MRTILAIVLIGIAQKHLDYSFVDGVIAWFGLLFCVAQDLAEILKGAKQ